MAVKFKLPRFFFVFFCNYFIPTCFTVQPTAFIHSFIQSYKSAQPWKCTLGKKKKNDLNERDNRIHLSVSKVVEDGGQFLGAGVLVVVGAPRRPVGVPPVHGEAVQPQPGLLLAVGLLQAGVQAVDLTARLGQEALQVPVLHA